MCRIVTTTNTPFSASVLGAATIESSGPNLEPGAVRVCVIYASRNGFNIGRKVSPCPGTGGVVRVRSCASRFSNRLCRIHPPLHVSGWGPTFLRGTYQYPNYMPLLMGVHVRPCHGHGNDSYFYRAVEPDSLIAVLWH